MFFAIILSFLLLSHYYLGIHLIKPLDLSKNQKILCWSLVFLSCIFEPLILTIGYKYPFPDKIKKILFFIGYAHLGFLAILLFLLIFKDLLFLGIKIIDWFAALKSSDPKLILPDSPEKRLFLKNSINKVIGVSTLALGGVALYEGRKLPNIKRDTVPI